jgi:signal transduction histidine kinase
VSTELEQLQHELQHAHQEIVRRDALLAIIAHELRNPIAPVLLGLETLVLDVKHAASLDRDALVRRIEQCRRYAIRLRTDLDRLLDFSRLRSGHIDLEPADVDVSRLVGAITEDMAPMIDAARCTLYSHLQVPLPAHLDPMRLNQIVWNLVSNAIKYAPGSQIDVTTSGDADTVTLVIADRGPGIPAEQQEAVFAQFERIVPHSHTGFGIGLWLVRSIVDAMDGTIALASTVGVGTSFTITLPKGHR